ncbi:MAG: general secretion pathway protein GspK, partial [Gammaproteobacteria bacterium]|nr:general secretion pathway protein GspK [Gammaproteobacteria bacterium]
MRQTNSQGFALPITLIVLSLLVVLSIGLSQMAGLNIAKIKQRQDHLTNELQLKNINQWVLYRLLTGTPSKHTRQSSTFSLPVDNSPIYYQNIKVQVQDAAGLMGLALYNQKKFEKLLKQITDKTSATKIAAQLKDWIDKDSLTSYQGMEVTGYIKTQQPMLPRNHAIRSLDELLELPAITPKLFNGSKNKQGLKEFILAGGTMTHNIATTPNVLLTPMLNISA